MDVQADRIPCTITYTSDTIISTLGISCYSAYVYISFSCTFSPLTSSPSPGKGDPEHIASKVELFQFLSYEIVTCPCRQPSEGGASSLLNGEGGALRAWCMGKFAGCYRKSCVNIIVCSSILS